MNLEIPVSQAILKSISDLDRFRGSWSADHAVPRERLARIEEATAVQSVAASCRLSGLRMSDSEVAGLLTGQSLPASDGRGIFGYAAVMRRALPANPQILASEDLRRLHAVLTGEPAETAAPSPWRTLPLQREAFDASGTATGRVFTTLPPHLVEAKIEDAVSWLELELHANERHPVLTIGAFILVFLAASPFEHGNGKLARLLISLLMRRAGYAFMPYASIERVIEELRGEYQEAFSLSQTRIWNGEANLEPWTQFFLEVLTRHRQRVETKVELERGVLSYPPLQQMILEAVREHGTVDAGLLLKATGANRNTLKDNLRRLVDRGVLQKTGERRGTRYCLGVGEKVVELAEPLS